MSAEERLVQIERKLDRLCVTLEAHTKRFDEAQETQAEQDDRVSRLIWGHNGTPGLVVRLDRLEQAQERSRWAARAMGGAIITLLVGGLWALLTG